MKKPNKKETERKLRKLTARLLALLDMKNATADIFLLGDREMRGMKQSIFKKSKLRTRKKPRVKVDVLAFPEPLGFPDPLHTKKFFGEIYLNWNMYRREPKRLGFLALHGVLHLVGYRHSRHVDAIMMEKLEHTLWPHLSSLV